MIDALTLTQTRQRCWRHDWLLEAHGAFAWTGHQAVLVRLPKRSRHGHVVGCLSHRASVPAPSAWPAPGSEIDGTCLRNFLCAIGGPAPRMGDGDFPILPKNTCGQLRSRVGLVDAWDHAVLWALLTEPPPPPSSVARPAVPPAAREPIIRLPHPGGCPPTAPVRGCSG